MEWLGALLAGLFVAAITVPVGVSGAVFLLPGPGQCVRRAESGRDAHEPRLHNVISVPGALARYRRHGGLRSSLTLQLLVGGVSVSAAVALFCLAAAL